MRLNGIITFNNTHKCVNWKIVRYHGIFLENKDESIKLCTSLHTIGIKYQILAAYNIIYFLLSPKN